MKLNQKYILTRSDGLYNDKGWKKAASAETQTT
jgi:hypothetical protein